MEWYWHWSKINFLREKYYKIHHGPELELDLDVFDREADQNPKYYGKKCIMAENDSNTTWSILKSYLCQPVMRGGQVFADRGGKLC